MRISDWSADVCSSDLHGHPRLFLHAGDQVLAAARDDQVDELGGLQQRAHGGAVRGGDQLHRVGGKARGDDALHHGGVVGAVAFLRFAARSEEHMSELQSLMRNSYAVFCLKKKNKYIKFVIQT